ncbi:hypothetical protein [Nitrospira sp. Kam-Ns4a]
MRRRQDRPGQLAAEALLCAALTACTSVDMIRMTNETFPPKASTDEVEVLDRVPTCPHIQLAELIIEESTDSYDAMQAKILKKAAQLGADAVLFAKPEKEIRHQVAYSSPMVGPWAYPMGWGYGGWMYDPYGFGMGYGSMAVPYDQAVRSLKGLAIRYTNASGPRC